MFQGAMDSVSSSCFSGVDNVNLESRRWRIALLTDDFDIALIAPVVLAANDRPHVDLNRDCCSIGKFDMNFTSGRRIAEYAQALYNLRRGFREIYERA